MRNLFYFLENFFDVGYVDYTTYHLREILQMLQGFLGNFLEWLP
jgi:predicted nucleotidyltransferase